MRTRHWVLWQVTEVLPVLKEMGPVLKVDDATASGLGPQCNPERGAEDAPRRLNIPAPGPLGHALVGVHFVYR